MSASLLREAAALMRERAEAAAKTDAWEWRSRDGNTWWPQSTRNGAYIQSWHPAVALAVADQLDAMAAVVEEAENTPLAIVAAGLAEKSLAVATAYLGRTS